MSGSPTLGRRGAWLVLFAALALAPHVLPQFYITLLNYVGLYALVSLG